jgi:hypothetical protein
LTFREQALPWAHPNHLAILKNIKGHGGDQTAVGGLDGVVVSFIREGQKMAR